MNSSNNLNENPLISIIIATYNRRDFILEAVRSALNQTYKNIEVIIVDDGSTDNTEKLVLDEYGSDSRVSYYYKENGKRASAFNYGYERSNGDFIAILDSDNRYLSDRLEKGLLALFNNPGYDISYGDIITIDESGKEKHRNNMRRFSGAITEHLIYDNCVSINTALVPRYCFERLGVMDTSYKRSDDYELWLRLSTQYKFIYVEEYLAEYRVMEDQLSSNTIGRLDVNLRLISEFTSKYKDIVEKRSIRKGMCRIHSLKSIYYSKNKQKLAAVREFIKAFSCRPIDRLTAKCFVRLLKSSAN